MGSRGKGSRPRTDFSSLDGRWAVLVSPLILRGNDELVARVRQIPTLLHA